MRNLAEDLDEFTPEQKRARGWMRRQRSAAGLEKTDASCWLAYVRQDRPYHDELLVALGRSPADVLRDAELYARANHAARRNGLGRWTMEVDGSEGVDPTYLVVVCREDNSYYESEAA